MPNHPSQKRYLPELPERAVRMVFDTIEAQHGERFGVITRVARQLGIGSESQRGWVQQAEVDGGQRPGTTTRGQGPHRPAGEGEPRAAPGQRDPQVGSGFFGAELDRRPNR